MRRPLLSIGLGISICLLVLSGCPRGSTLHKVTVAEHNFRFTVQAFQDGEIAAHDQGLVPDDLHLKMQGAIFKISLAGKDLDDSLATGASMPTIKAKLDAIYALLDSLNSDGVLAIKNPTTKATLEVALDGIKSIIDSALTQVQ